MKGRVEGQVIVHQWKEKKKKPKLQFACACVRIAPGHFQKQAWWGICCKAAATSAIVMKKFHLSSRSAMAGLDQLCNNFSQHFHIALAHLADIDCGLCYEMWLPRPSPQQHCLIG